MELHIVNNRTGEEHNFRLLDDVTVAQASEMCDIMNKSGEYSVAIARPVVTTGAEE